MMYWVCVLSASLPLSFVCVVVGVWYIGPSHAVYRCPQAMVQRGQLGDELGRMRERFEEHVRASQAKTQQEREAARQENHFLIDDLNKKVGIIIIIIYFTSKARLDA